MAMQGSHLAKQNGASGGASPADVKLQMAAEENDNYIDKMRPAKPSMHGYPERKPMQRVPPPIEESLDKQIPQMDDDNEMSPFLMNDTAAVETRPSPGRRPQNSDSVISMGPSEAPPNYNSVMAVDEESVV